MGSSLIAIAAEGKGPALEPTCQAANSCTGPSWRLLGACGTLCRFFAERRLQICPSCFAQESDESKFCGLCGSKLIGVKPSSNTLIGIKVGKYTIEKLIARGGMGEVYLATHEGLGQKVAVKILNKRYKGDATVVMRFFNEAQSYCRVSHPNAVKIHDFGQLEDGTLYMIMEFVPGDTLTDHLGRTGPLATKRAVRLSIQLADVLLAAHSQGIVHRDLKPDNIMLQEVSPGRYQLKVLDFGIAKVLDEASGTSQLTETGMVFGTPEFMSPEQAQGLDVDHRTDIYAFGMLIFYMVTANLPFHGGPKLSILNRQVHEAPKRPSEIAPSFDVDPHLEAIVMKCLEKDRVNRYSDFAALLGDLERVAQGTPPISAGLKGKTGRPKVVASPTAAYNNPSAVDPLQAMFDAAPSSPRLSTAKKSRDVTVRRAADPEVVAMARNPHDEKTRVAHDTAPPVTTSGSDATRRVGSGPKSTLGSGPKTPAGTAETRAATPSSMTDELIVAESAPYAIGDPARSATAPRPSEPQPASGPIVIADASAPGRPVDEDVITGEQDIVDDADTLISESQPAISSGAEDGFSFGGDDESDQFGLGVAMIDDGGHHRPYRRERKRGSGGLIAAVVLIALAGVAVWFFALRDTGSTEEKKPTTTTTQETAPVVDEPDVAEVADVMEIVPLEPAPPPIGLDSKVRELAGARVVADLMDERTKAADFKGSAKFERFLEKKYRELDNFHEDRIRGFSTNLETAVALRKAGLKSARKDCEEADRKATELDSLSPAAALEVRDAAAKCKVRRERPPSTIE